MLRFDGRKRVVIENVQPSIDNGRYAVKRIVGDVFNVLSDIYTDGHDLIGAELLYKKKNNSDWSSSALTLLSNDRWQGYFTLQEDGVYLYTIRAWIDHFLSWQSKVIKKFKAGQDIHIDLQTGSQLIEAAAGRALSPHSELLIDTGRLLVGEKKPAKAYAIATDKEITLLMCKYPDKSLASDFDTIFAVVADRKKAQFSSWYEFFPRSCGPHTSHGTFADCEKVLPSIASMGFDTIYLPPIHPIGRSHRKGKNNTLTSSPTDPGSPWAIGSERGGHTSIEPMLGTMDEFEHFIKKANHHGLDVAIDIAFQCSPDHPYVKEHPEWFLHRSDGTIQYAENPPKKYEDIVPFNFECPEWKDLWDELKRVVVHWIQKGVHIFRVDNPHTKPFSFWEWLISEIRREYPSILFLAEAFTRPKIMYRLGKIGFSQSYTYFTWRNSKKEIEDYCRELVSEPVADFFRPNFWPNTPDILPDFLQLGDVKVFSIRVILAATLSSNYGIYGPAFECGENSAIANREEYFNSEKYEIKEWNWSQTGILQTLITKLNKIRKENEAFHETRNLNFLDTTNELIIAYCKPTIDLKNVIIVVVNLDPYHTQKATIEIPLERLGIKDQPYLLLDQLVGERYICQSKRVDITLDPSLTPACIFKLHRRMHRESDFEYY